MGAPVPLLSTPPGFITTPLALFLMVTGFFAGGVFIPVMAFARARIPILSDALARICWELGGIGIGYPMLSWQASETYELRSGTGEEPDEAGWKRCGLNPMAVAVEKSRSVWGPFTVNRDELAARDEEGTVATGTTRGGVKYLFDTSHPGEWFVDAPAWLFDFIEAADGSGVIKAKGEEFEDTGGDNGGHSLKVHMAMASIMTLFGGVLGWVVFFG